MYRLIAVIAAACCFWSGNAVAQRYSPYDPFVFYEGNSCTQDRLFSFGGFGSYSCTGFPSPCFGNNDEARSVLIKFDNLPFGFVKTYYLRVYDSPVRAGDKDSATITIVKRPAGRSTYCVSTFNKSKVWDFGNISRRRGRTDDGKIDGKISYIDSWYSP